MRTVTFSNDRVQKQLKSQFVCSYTNIQGDLTAGASFSHAPNDKPGPCGRGAGRQNVQTIFMTPAGKIYHLASGYLSPDDLLDELKFASELFALLQREPEQGERIVVDQHRRYLKERGFSNEQINAADNALTKMFLSGINPQDFGMKFPQPQDFGFPVRGAGLDIFGDIAAQRVLHDHRFVIANPLIDRRQFDQDPGALLGRHKSFFGSQPGMDMSRLGGPFAGQANPNLKGRRRKVNDVK